MEALNNSAVSDSRSMKNASNLERFLCIPVYTLAKCTLVKSLLESMKDTVATKVGPTIRQSEAATTGGKC